MVHKLQLRKIQTKIKKSIDELLAKSQRSGAIIVAANNKIIYQKYVGYADLSKKIPISINTQFLAGSVTKQFTAVAMLKALLDKNRDISDHSQLKSNIQLALNKTIEHYLPAEHEIWNGLMPEWAKVITIHQLLVHSSGIINYNSLPDFNKQKFSNHSEIITFFKNHELEFIPGEKFSYCNSGYFLLGIIIEQITQKSLDVYLENILFKPFEMRSTFFPMSGTVDDLIRSDARFHKLARGYQYEMEKPNAALEEVKRYEPMLVPGAGGSLISTPEDLLTWNNALYAGKIIPHFLLDLLLKPYLVTENAKTYYGYGIEIMKSNVLGEYYSHRGGIPGFRSILTFIPSLQLSIITMQNIEADQEKLIPEIKEIKTSLPSSLSLNETAARLTEIIESKYPSILQNRNRYEFAPIYDEIIKILDKFGYES